MAEAIHEIIQTIIIVFLLWVNKQNTTHLRDAFTLIAANADNSINLAKAFIEKFSDDENN